MAGKPNLTVIRTRLGAIGVDPLNGVPELKIRAGGRPHDVEPEVTDKVELDLHGRPKLLTVFGPGGSGKSTFLRWVAGRAIAAGRPITLATTDVGRSTLSRFFSDVEGPRHEAGVMAWLERAISFLMEEPMNAAFDFRADMTLVPLLQSVPDLHRLMEQKGITPVAVYMLTIRSEDLTVLAQMEAAGFCPDATVLVLNAAKASTQSDLEYEFRRVRGHSVFRAAVERGAVQMWMPSLGDAAPVIEEREVSFIDAAADQSDIMRASRVRHWLIEIEQTMKPIIDAGWLP